MEYSNEVIKIVEGALKSDKVKVTSYTKLLIDKLKQDNQARLANSFIKILNNGMSSLSKNSINDVMKVPIDQESRLPMADILQPTQVADVNVVLNKSVYKQIEKFVEYYENTSKLINQGIKVPNSILLYGPPGCGKNKLASYICAKTNLPLITARLDGMISSYLGSTAKNIRAIFEYAHAVPCILFLDEFDAIAKVRDDNNELGELKRVVNSLLQNIDNLTNGSIIIAATNHDHLLDPAVWRRFGFKINIAKPDTTSRMSLINSFLSGKELSDKDTEIAATVFDGLSGADIEEICNKSLIDAVLSNRDMETKILYENFFDFIKIEGDSATEMTEKEVNNLKVKYLRKLNKKTFSYNRIAQIIGVSKGYVAGFFDEKEDELSE
jgi:SpoVK/Ycf46/Vps4 family AAA+-type ATPase